MQVAVSDFDGTLGDYHGVRPQIVACIQTWREAGNKFGICTGRGPAMMKPELVRSRIPFDFIICCNGAVIYDQDLNLTLSRNIPDEVIADLVDHPSVRTSMHCAMIDAGPIRLSIRDRVTWYLSSGLPFQEISLEEARDMRGVSQLSLAYYTAEESERCAQALNARFGQLHAHRNSSCLDVTLRGVDKGNGVADLLRLNGWEQYRTLVIGDGENDLPMIARFGGFTVPAANDVLKQAALRVYDDVGAMLLDNL